jgi:outer membrane protein TolC
MRLISAALLAAGLPISMTTAQTADTAANAGYFAFVARLVADAQRNSPRLKAARSATESAGAAATSVRALDPPRFAVELYQAPIRTFPNPFNGQKEIDYSLEQMLPFPGKLPAMARAEEDRAAMLSNDARTRELDIVRDVYYAAAEIYLADRDLEINAEKRRQAALLLDAVRAHYENGTGQQADVLRAQATLSRTALDSISLSQQRASAEAMINALRGRSAPNSIPITPAAVPQPAAGPVDVYLSLALQNRPELLSMNANILMRQSEGSAAAKEWLPDFVVRGTYKQMLQENDDWSLMLGMTVPIAPWTLKKPASLSIKSAYSVQSAQSDYEDQQQMVQQQVRDAYFRMQSAYDRAALLESTILPQTQAAYQSSLAAYQNGSDDFEMVIGSLQMVLDNTEERHMMVMQWLKARADLERAVGAPLEERTAKENP